jgi:hypothetical protein
MFKQALNASEGSSMDKNNHNLNSNRLIALMSMVISLMLSLMVFDVHAIPAFAEQTGQPCSQCHVGAFGPQLKPYGRDFKLYGYTASDGEKHLPGIAITTQSSLSHVEGSNSGGNYTPTSNSTLLDQQVSAYFGGHITEESGAFLQVTYEPGGGPNPACSDPQNPCNYNAGNFHWDNMDLRYAHLTKLGGKDFLIGATVNNAPTMQDVWNSTPIWAYPYNGPSQSNAGAPAAATLLDNTLQQNVIGAGIYGMWNDTVYVEATAYKGLGGRALTALGQRPGNPSDNYPDVMPYWRIALQHDSENHNFEIGALGLMGSKYPSGDTSFGAKDRFRDHAFDLNYQYKGSDNHYISAHAIYEIENMDLNYSFASVAANNRTNQLKTFRADVSYSYENRITPTIGYFHTMGTSDATYWTNSAAAGPLSQTSASPNSRGFVAEIAYAFLGQTKSIPQWANARLSLQWYAFQQYDGLTANAGDHNTLYLSLWLAFSPTYAYEVNH